jgi:integrase
MATIKFFIQSKSNPAGIYVRVKEGRNIDAKAKTKYIINPENWSSVKGQPKNLKDAESKKLNNELEDLRNEILNHYNKCIGEEKNTLWLKKFLNPENNDEAIPKSLLNYFDYYIKHQTNLVKKTTIDKIKVVQKMVEKFQKEVGQNYLLTNVGIDFRLDFETFCAKNGYAKGTTNRAMKHIKSVCYHAERNGEDINRQIKSMVFKNPKSVKIYLTPSEIKKIEDTDLKQDYLKNARDWLIISTETGQRVSDFMRFDTSKIREQGGRKIIEFTQKKNEDRLIALPLSTKVIEILNKNNGEFPRKISDVKYNLYIKEVAEKAGLNEPVNGSIKDAKSKRNINGIFPKYKLITSHIGRRSFATNYYGIIPTSLLMTATGHATETTFLIYIGKTPAEKSIQLADYIK